MTNPIRDVTATRRSVLEKGAIVGSASLLGLASVSGNVAAHQTGCARTPGYWKNHPEEWHGASQHFHLGTSGDLSDRYNYFTEHTTPSGDVHPSALEILQTSPKGDKTIIMAQHLIATELNILNGSTNSCMPTYGARADAREWLQAHGLVGSGQEDWDGGEAIKDTLDAYNNGELCAPSCDEEEEE